MTDPKNPVPTSDPEEKFSDELFDAYLLDDSDSDFLGDLDRVLTSKGDESEAEVLSTNMPEAFDPFDLHVDTGNGGQDPILGSAPASDEIDLFGADAQPAPKAQYGPQNLRQHRDPAAAPETATGKPGIDPAVRAGIRPAQTGAGDGKASPSGVVSPAPGSADRKPAPAAKKGKDRKPTWRRALSNLGVASPPPRVSPVWLGITALLAMIGIGVGVAAIWLQMDIENHLAWMETKLASTAAPSRVEQEVRDERLQLLEQRLQDEIAGLRANNDGLRSSLEQRVEHQNEQLAEDLEALESALAEVHGHLETVQQQLVDIEKRPNKVPRPPVKATAAPAATGSGAAPKAGKWVVNLISFRTRAKADKWVVRLRDAGIQTTVSSVERQGRTWYRVLVGGFDDFAKAKAFAAEVRSKPDLSSAWVGRN